MMAGSKEPSDKQPCDAEYGSSGSQGETLRGGGQAAAAARAELEALDSRVELIQALIPPGLEAVHELLQREVAALAGAQESFSGYCRRAAGLRPPGPAVGPGLPGGSEGVAVRVRDLGRGQEVPLRTCQSLRQLQRAEEAAWQSSVFRVQTLSTAD